MSAPARVLLVGASGLMGRAVVAATEKEDALTIAAEANRGDAIDQSITDCDVVIDFSAADATEAICRVCSKNQKPLVLGTTGHSPAQKEFVVAAARLVPIVFAANFSIGVNALFALTRRAAELLGNDFDLDVIELHHRTKKDAPSGTAKRLAEILAEARGDHLQLAPHSIRAGDIVGEHTIIFTGAGERVELVHRATSRATFALGALRAAHWVIDRPPGLYSMEDVLGR